jgi:probable HAF family extracellular repeat protein
MRRLWIVLGIVLGLLGCASLLPSDVYALSYTVTPLGALGDPQTAETRAFGINQSGAVTGDSHVTGTTAHAFIYSGGIMVDIGTLGGVNSTGLAINNGGQVTGASDVSAGASHAFLYGGGAMTDLGTLPGFTESVGNAINDLGQVAGHSYSLLAGSPTQAFLYSGGTMTPLGTLGGRDSYAFGINNGGQITGQSLTTGNLSARAFLYSGGQMTDLGTLGGTNSVGMALNDAGQVTGLAYLADFTYHAFVYSNGTMTDLGTLTPGGFSLGAAINSAGHVTGSASSDPTLPDDVGGMHAFVYRDGVMIDLNAFAPAGVTFTDGFGINDAGQIIVRGNTDDIFEGYLLTPVAVPEPALLMLLGSAVVGLCVATRRRAGNSES